VPAASLTFLSDILKILARVQVSHSVPAAGRKAKV
jgi:hypothetical protein